MTKIQNPIGVFDSGYGGLSILKALRAQLPEQEFLYLGDHVHAPYGPREKDDIINLTLRNMEWLFDQKCQLVILACSSASSYLRSIQRDWLHKNYPDRRILGVVVPTIEKVTGVRWDFTDGTVHNTDKGTAGVFATETTVKSQVYALEIHKRTPNIQVFQQACPRLAAMIEDGATEQQIEQAVSDYVSRLSAQMGGGFPDYVILGCTHYALISQMFRRLLPTTTNLVDQPACVASSLHDYLGRHPHFRSPAVNAHPCLFTSGDAERVNKNARAFMQTSGNFQPAHMESCLSLKPVA